MMRKRSLEIVLSKLMDVPNPNPELEQYRTPAAIVAEIVLMAFGNGSIEGRSVLEPGCGGAPFLIAAGLFGAGSITGIEIDPESVRIAKQNIGDVDRSLGTDLATISEIIEGDIKDYSAIGNFDTVLMNPPFGAQKKGADRPFIDVATSSGGEIYSLHNSKGISFVKERLAMSGYRILEQREYLLDIKHRFSFHTEESSEIVAVLLHSKPLSPGMNMDGPAMTNVK